VRTPFIGTDLSDREIEQLIERANIARAQFLYENSGTGLRMIAWSGVACLLALLVLLDVGPTDRQVLQTTASIEHLATGAAP
jgi:hypothetical protein